MDGNTCVFNIKKPDQFARQDLRKFLACVGLILGGKVQDFLATDSFFGSDAYKKYDAIIASYHDQGLIPFKTLTFGKGVNYTAGLNVVRTSPDHGTAYNISGKNVANESSFKSAIVTALNILKNRGKI